MGFELGCLNLFAWTLSGSDGSVLWKDEEEVKPLLYPSVVTRT